MNAFSFRRAVGGRRVRLVGAVRLAVAGGPGSGSGSSSHGRMTKTRMLRRALWVWDLPPAPRSFSALLPLILSCRVRRRFSRVPPSLPRLQLPVYRLLVWCWVWDSGWQWQMLCPRAEPRQSSVGDLDHDHGVDSEWRFFSPSSSEFQYSTHETQNFSVVYKRNNSDDTHARAC